MEKYQFGHYETSVQVTMPNGSPNYQFTSFKKSSLQNEACLSRPIQEQVLSPKLRSSSAFFDGLFALALEEAEQNKVEKITDWSFEASDLSVFETGELWNYVWTRDSAYSAFLSLGQIDPERMMRTLLFKISDERVSSKKFIVQDTGSGGAWPISTDRVVLALAAQKLAPLLPAKLKKQFEETLFEALSNTAQIDREVAFDLKSGLYRGEQSFLDWREQSYPLWTANDTLWIGRSKALSTNVCHYAALMYLQELATKLKKKTSHDYQAWAKNLKEKINERFFDEEAGLYRSILMDYFLNEPLKSYDLLGNSLAVIFKVASDDKAKRIVANYPYTEVGAPVIFPESKEVPIYHNRAIWPFVTAFALIAAKKVGNATVAAKNCESLIRGSACQLSNMENFDFLTLEPKVEDGKNSGPVVNSKRQLWSVAAYLSMIFDSLVGIKFEEDRLSLSPFFPVSLCKRYFSSSKVELQNISWGEHQIHFSLHLPELKGKAEGALVAKKMLFNGKETSQLQISKSELKKENQIELFLTYQEDYSTINLITVRTPEQLSHDDERKFFAPSEPRFSLNGDSSEVTFEPSDLNILIFENGQLKQTVKGGGRIEVDRHKALTLSFMAQDPVSLNQSFPTQAMDFNYRWQLFDFKGERLSGQPQFLPAEMVLPELTKSHFLPIRVNESGVYKTEFLYLNPGPINTGITACLKRVQLLMKEKSLQKEIIIMPHTGEQGHIRISSSMELKLEKDEEYQLVLEDFVNMSDLLHFENYKKRGGASGRENWAYLFGCRLKKITGV